MPQVKGVLLDMDGVLYNAEVPIAGADTALRRLGEGGIPYLFVTNTTSRGRDVLVDKLRRFGIPADESQILTPCVAAAAWLRNRDERVALFVRPSARPEFDGLPVLADDAEQGADSVVIGDLGEHWDYHTLNRAFRLLHANPEARLIALGMTRYWQTARGVSLDVAPFVAALEHATGRKALVLGKPAPAFFESAAQQLALPPAQILMVGDDIEADVGGAQRAGIKGALVRTGKFRTEDLERGVVPDVILDSIADLPDWWSSEAD